MVSWGGKGITEEREESLDVMDMFIILIVVIFHKCVHMPRFTKFYTLNICGLFMSVYLSKFVFQKHTHTKGEPKGTQGSRRVQMEGSVS